MILITKHFGEIEINENEIYEFPEGLPGFEEQKQLALIGNPTGENTFQFLQAIENGDLAFAVINPFAVVLDYEADIPESEIEVLEVTHVSDVLLLSIVVVPEDLHNISANLLAPVVLNIKNKKGKQVNLNSNKYSIRHYIFEALKRMEVEADAGTFEKEK